MHQRVTYRLELFVNCDNAQAGLPFAIISRIYHYSPCKRKDKKKKNESDSHLVCVHALSTFNYCSS